MGGWGGGVTVPDLVHLLSTNRHRLPLHQRQYQLLYLSARSSEMTDDRASDSTAREGERERERERERGRGGVLLLLYLRTHYREGCREGERENHFT